MCFFNLGASIAANQVQKRIEKKFNEQALLQQKETLQRQREAVADRNAQTTETIKDNQANNVKRTLNMLNVPLLKTFGVGNNTAEDIGYYGLNLGGNQ